MAPRLSVLDLIPTRTCQTTAEALASSVSLARTADQHGFARYWVAEHHNMPAVASTSPPVLIAMMAAATETIRVGSGGVMLPNHAPLVVAEQFALLEAAYPGRVDLGLGRAPGSDPVTSWALRHGGGGVQADAADHFGEYVGNVLAMMAPEGVGLQLNGRTHPLRATPYAVGVPAVWLLGSSDFSARLAARMGLPYVFAHHFSGSGTEAALQIYREEFTASQYAERPTTFLTANVVAADTGQHAAELARPQLLNMLALRTGRELRPQLEVEEAAAIGLSEPEERLVRAMASRWFIGTGEQVSGELAELADRFGVDEVMVHPVAGARRGERADRAPAREETLRLLAEEARTSSPTSLH